MSHPKKSALQAFLDYELSPRRQKQTEDHFAACASCREKLKNAKAVLESVGLDLKNLNPKRVPSPAPFVEPSRERVSRKKHPIGSLIFTPVRVPSGLLVFMGLMILIFAGLFYSERHQKGAGDVLLGKSEKSNFLTITSSEGTTEFMPLNIPWDRFTPAKDPIILVMKERP